MERYGAVLLVAIPFFLVLIGIEKMYGLWKGADRTPTMDMVASLLSGLTNIVKDVLGLSVSILAYDWMVAHWSLVSVSASIGVYAVVFLLLDFQGYWVHRWAHEINFFWNKHLIHHSSEEFNLPCALRQSVSSFVNLFTFFLLPLALLGVPAVVVATVAPIHLFLQFWYHTRHIKRMGWLENIIVTPAHHRVHHAINPQYLDKNYGQIFILWDKWFGTFQEELEGVPAVYGITIPVRTWNPIKINFQHLWQLAKDAYYARSWRDKLRLWWMPTGWRPADVAARFPLAKIDDIYQFEKYNPPVPPMMRAWAIVHLLLLLGFVTHFLSHLAIIGSPGIFVYGLFIFVTVYSMADVYDLHPRAWGSDLLRLLLGGYLLYKDPFWFGLGVYWPSVGNWVAVYLIVSFGLNRSLYFATLTQVEVQN